MMDYDTSYGVNCELNFGGYIMVYKFCYFYGGETKYHTCTTIREANIWFDMLIALKCKYIRIETIRKVRDRHDKN